MRAGSRTKSTIWSGRGEEAKASRMRTQHSLRRARPGLRAVLSALVAQAEAAGGPARPQPVEVCRGDVLSYRKGKGPRYGHERRTQGPLGDKLALRGVEHDGHGGAG